MYNEERAFGFTTRNKVTLLKAYPEDIGTIMRLFSTETGRMNREDKKKMRWDWLKELKKEINDFDNYTFIIRDKCNKEIGLVTSETRDNKSWEYYIWIPNSCKRVQYQNYICECLLEYIEDYTDIERVNAIVSLVSFKSQTALMLKKNVIFKRDERLF
jgi:hypothetical protein